MERISVKAYADKRGISKQSVYDQLKQEKYKYLFEEVAEDGLPHIVDQKNAHGRMIRVMDDFAMEEISKAAKATSPIKETNSSERLQELEAENKKLIDEIKQSNIREGQWKDLTIEMMNLLNLQSFKHGYSPFIIDSKKYDALPISSSLNLLPVDADSVEIKNIESEMKDKKPDNNETDYSQETPDENKKEEVTVLDQEEQQTDSKAVSDSESNDATDSEREEELNDTDPIKENTSEESSENTTSEKQPEYSLEEITITIQRKLLLEQQKQKEAELEKKKAELEKLEEGFHPFKTPRKRTEIQIITDDLNIILKQLQDLTRETPE